MPGTLPIVMAMASTTTPKRIPIQRIPKTHVVTTLPEPLHAPQPGTTLIAMATELKMEKR